MLPVRQKCMILVNSFGNFILKSRFEATLAAMLTATIPFFSWISLMIVCLVTLRKGMREGLLVLLWGCVPAVISSYFLGSGLYSLETLLAYIFLWGVASLLRATASWKYVLEVSAVFAVAIIMVVHSQIPDLEKIYLEHLMEIYRNGGINTNTDNSQLVEYYMQNFVYFLLGVQTTLYTVYNLFCLLVARWIQAVLYNPQGLSKELKEIRLDWFVWIVGALFLILGLKMSPSWALDSFPVFIVLFFFAGWSVAHDWISKRYKFPGALFGFYFLLILLIPASMIPLILLALVDTVWNIRKKF